MTLDMQSSAAYKHKTTKQPTLICWFHDPCTGGILSKLLNKKIVIRWQDECDRNEI